MEKLLILLIILKVASSYIYYDTGMVDDFQAYVYSSFVCKNGYSKIATKSFSNQFENTPQVFFVHEQFDLNKAELGFQLAITAITQTCIDKIYCNMNRVITVSLRWFAIDDQRIEVYSNFNMANPDDKTFQIKNPNAKTGFVAITSFNYTNTETTLSYNWKTWFETDTPNSHSQVWVAYQFTKTFKPLECFSIRTSRKEVLNLATLPTFTVELIQTNQIYTTNGNYQYVVDKSITPLKMGIQVKCENGMKIQADFNKCNSCSTKKNQSFMYNCFNQMNYVGFFPLFQQAFPQYNLLKINMQSSLLEIINVIYDQTLTEQVIVKIQILNQ
ncbi:unnamed protein product (macronuclear) [Paramecium tetraurelia]|uniref:H-type lectin domain-containing protein n=1 Tax=Paramecium tetraurelia TaxID=5888 RepID=A0E053_PARTE|nr:uncharacterized protein GSPATT00021838001 [Paramecium tetraurelia]CAK88670.1 unnamed protein product [Paramecium tetraurelia]|eukprot:XP_001456067.1 hypothetical protein (macronuclear) [Paramecium tetraurelia strain d4-2]